MHPFLEYLSTTYAGAPNVFVEETSAVMVIRRNADPREKIVVFLESDDEETLNLCMQAKVRYPITDSRNRKYLEYLEREVSGSNLRLELLPPRTISLSGALNQNSVNYASTWKDACINLDYFIRTMSKMMQLATFVTHFNIRVANRGGTEPYKKALPSRLAAMTVCGYLTDDAIH